jgi:hypothetical protein
MADFTILRSVLQVSKPAYDLDYSTVAQRNLTRDRSSDKLGGKHDTFQEGGSQQEASPNHCLYLKPNARSPIPIPAFHHV